MSEEARVACGPGNTRTLLETKKPSKPPDKSVRVKTFTTQTNTEQAKGPTEASKEKTGKISQKDPVKCTFCKGAHIISKCERFLGQDKEKKTSFAMRNGLCFGCLRRNHMWRDCRNKDPSLMEGEKPSSKDAHDGKKQKEEETQVSHDSTASSYKVQTGKQRSG